MIIIGELINTSRKSIAAMVKEQDQSGIQKVAYDQSANGANYIDVNAGTFMDSEAERLKWLITTVQSKTDCSCCIDSPNPSAVEAALSVHKGQAMINSISLEKKRYDALLPIIAGTGLKVIALCMSDEGMPETADERLNIADKLVNGLVKNNVLPENIFIDPLVQPVAIRTNYGVEFLDALEKIKTALKGVHTVCGLSNISYGLPARKLMNRTFMAMAIAKGLDAAIINPLDNKIMANISAALALVEKDDFCMNYIKAYRAGKLA
ncbi:MAG: methyltetrahydrofolate cobalamin methyltransferase [Deltaproteobacteria bacterium]|nr:methyltetrahydrofolate cobalamin methyltransferase [Deltaproteobacteria bacterium]